MVKYLQVLLLFIIFSVSLDIVAQNERIKFSKVEQTPVIQKTDAANINEKYDVPLNKPENANNVTQIKSVEAENVSIKAAKLKEENDLKSVNRTQFSDNVIYEKEILPADDKVVSSEKPKVKVTQSANYKQRVVKEDIHPAVEYSSSGITSDKRIYLEQEANDLEREILQNTGKADYDLVQKQKQLSDIRKMLQ